VYYARFAMPNDPDRYVQVSTRNYPGAQAWAKVYKSRIGATSYEVSAWPFTYRGAPHVEDYEEVAV
jgi:hypothetical protein